MPFTKFIEAIGFTGREEEFTRLLREHEFMLLAFAPATMDVFELDRTLHMGGTAGQLYEALVKRRRTEPDVRSSNIPSRLDKDIG